MPDTPYIVVLGGSYVGIKTAQTLASTFHGTPQVLLVEQNSHFQHLFAFPRFAIVGSPDVDTRKAFIPYKPGAFADCPPNSGSAVQAKAIRLTKHAVKLDRKVLLDGKQVDEVPYSYLVIATGTKLTPPSSLPGSEKLDGIAYLQEHVKQIQRSKKIVCIGGGAVGIQMATDIKELHPKKEVTLVHSRSTLMNRFDSKLHDVVQDRMHELGITMVLGSRVKLPQEGYPTDGSDFKVELQDGRMIDSDFAIICTGQTPQSAIIEELSSQSINEYGFIKTKKTLQLNDDALPNIFAVGDIAATGAPKAARPGGLQAEIVAKNIQHLMAGEKLHTYSFDVAAIHLTLGISKNVIFRNPVKKGGEPMVKLQDNGRLDMGIDDVWKRRGGGDDFHL